MKFVLCDNVGFGASCSENLDVMLAHKWSDSRADRFELLLEKALRNHADYVVLLGRLLGADRITEAVLDNMFNAISRHADILIISCITRSEYNRVSYRSDLPKNFAPVCIDGSQSYQDEEIEVSVSEGDVRIHLVKQDYDLNIVRQNGIPSMLVNEEIQVIPSFEPEGYVDLEKRIFGYGVFEQTDEGMSYSIMEEKMFQFITAEVKVKPEDTMESIQKKVDDTARYYDSATFLRLTLTGSTAFGMGINTDMIRSKLQNRVFYAQVFDNTTMNVDASEFENDISLRSEFMRLALHDGSISESERKRLIRMGWNALDGKEVSA